MAKALELERPIIALESMEQQLDILYNIPLDATLDLIMSIPLLTMEEWVEIVIDSVEAGMDDLADAYEINDIALLIQLVTEPLLQDIDSAFIAYQIERLYNWRSTYYANEIARLLQETEEPTTFFVAVGISHIVRSIGSEEFTDIVQQLELMGFEVEALWD